MRFSPSASDWLRLSLTLLILHQYEGVILRLDPRCRVCVCVRLCVRVLYNCREFFHAPFLKRIRLNYIQCIIISLSTVLIKGCICYTGGNPCGVPLAVFFFSNEPNNVAVSHWNKGDRRVFVSLVYFFHLFSPIL